MVEKLEKVDDECGGFGQILVFGFDYSDDPAPWLQSLTALQEDVLPRVAHLVPAKPEAAAHRQHADDTAPARTFRSCRARTRRIRRRRRDTEREGGRPPTTLRRVRVAPTRAESVVSGATRT